MGTRSRERIRSNRKGGDLEEGLLRKIQEKREAISWQVNIEVDPLRLASRGGIRTKACLNRFKKREVYK